MVIELNSNILRKYLYENYFSQNLISRQNEIDFVSINSIPKEKIKIEEKLVTKEMLANHRMVRIAKLYNTRLLINLTSTKSLKEIDLKITKK